MGELDLYPFQLLDVRLYEATIERFEPDEQAEVEGAAELPLSLDLSLVKHSDRRISAFFTLSTKSPEEQAHGFHIRLTLQGLFESRVDLEEIEQEVWQEFEDLSAACLLWPYARECMQSIAHRMREDLPILPTLNRLEMSSLGSKKTDADTSLEITR